MVWEQICQAANERAVDRYSRVQGSCHEISELSEFSTVVLSKGLELQNFEVL
jgi:hypothetical protein